MKTYILYHKNCTDGFGAAYAAWKKYFDNAIYIAVSYDEPLPEIELNSLVFVLDFCLPVLVTEKIKSHSKVITLDHHIAAEEKIKVSTEYVYDINRSGAKIAWDYFHPNTTNKIIDYISDKDLGKFELFKCKEIICALESYGRDFKVWDNLDIDQLLQEGIHILRSKNNEINILMEKAYMFQMGSHKIPVINTSIFMSEVADRLLEVYPDSKFSGTYNAYEKDGKMYRKWSLRSKQVDVNDIAKKYGGGGHKFAAAFIEELNDLKKGEK